MIELYPNIRDEVKEVAELAWSVALAQKNPMDAAQFLNTVVLFYEKQYTEEEVDFLQFYFDMKLMEMMKE